MKFAPHQGEIAAQPTSLMKSRRLNRSKCIRFPLPGRRGLGEIGRAAVRDFDAAFDRFESFTTDAVEATRACLSAFAGKRTNGPTSWDAA